MKRIYLITLMLLFVLVTFCNSHANEVNNQRTILPTYPVVVVGNWHVKFNGEKANDFHISGMVQSLFNYMPKLDNHFAFDVTGGTTWHMNGYSIKQDPTYPKNWYFTADFKTDGVITSGDIVHFGLKFITNYCNYARIISAYWTYDGEPVERVYLPGFNIYRNNGFLFGQFFNNIPGPDIVMMNLQFAVSDIEIPLEDMITDGLGDPNGQGTNDKYAKIQWIPYPKEVITFNDLGESVAINLEEIDIKLEPNQFLLFRATDKEGIPWWGQHQEPPVILSETDVAKTK